MRKLMVLRGKYVVKIFSTFGFQHISQKGSHVKMRRIENSSKQTLTIPLHAELDKGTLKAIFVKDHDLYQKKI